VHCVQLVHELQKSTQAIEGLGNENYNSRS
jgi:hypothetical protein